jgi:monofunctional biosynthetic peptidoglycan transglycosylase
MSGREWSRLPMRIRRASVVRGAVAAAAAAFAGLVYVYLTLPDVRPLVENNPTSTAFMELRAREARAAGKQPRRAQRWVAYGGISPHVKRAVLVAEDASFWQHEGVDYDELQKSIEVDWMRGTAIRGASTITQQLAKNLYLSPSRNPIRKLRELIIARRLEAELTKARIFEIYLNVIEWGDGLYGIDAAAGAYFGASAGSIGPSQAALLAGAIINPRLLNPARPSPRLVRRQELILRRMGAVSPPVETPHPAAPNETEAPPNDEPPPDALPVPEMLPPPEMPPPPAQPAPADAPKQSSLLTIAQSDVRSA